MVVTSHCPSSGLSQHQPRPLNGKQDAQGALRAPRGSGTVCSSLGLQKPDDGMTSQAVRGMASLIYKQVGTESEPGHVPRTQLLLRNFSGSENSPRPFQGHLQGTAATQGVGRGFKEPELTPADVFVSPEGGRTFPAESPTKLGSTGRCATTEGEAAKGPPVSFRWRPTRGQRPSCMRADCQALLARGTRPGPW